ncbi:MAG: hypothetical protein AAGA94_03785, partial [Pseudomonadota bacterium]
GDVAPETIGVAVAFEERGFFGTRAIESIAGDTVDTDRLPFFKGAVTFGDVDVRLKAVAPGRETLTFFDGEVGVLSRADNIFAGEGALVNDGEELLFKLQDGPFGDATEVFFDFADLRGDEEVEVIFFDDGIQIGLDVYDASGGEVTADLNGVSFDAVRIGSVGDTAFSLDGFAFERLDADEFAFA